MTEIAGITYAEPLRDWQLLYRVVDYAQATCAFSPQPTYPAGRWTSQGTPALYASLTAAGALLEKLAHCAPDEPEDFILAVASMPRARLMPTPQLPRGWCAYPYRADVQHVGDAWLASRTALAFRVPSALAPGAHNVLLDPTHPDAASARLLRGRRIRIAAALRRGEACAADAAPTPRSDALADAS